VLGHDKRVVILVHGEKDLTKMVKLLGIVQRIIPKVVVPKFKI